MNDVKIIEVDENNFEQYPPRCFIDVKNEGHIKKVEWMLDRIKEGMKIKILHNEKNKQIGFIEYIPGEYAWRNVDAAGYMFIHCVWITPNMNKNKGYASLLINESIEEAWKQKRNGVAVLTSNGSFMADKSVFLKNGFRSVDFFKPSFDLMVHQFKESPLPKINVPVISSDKYPGLHIVYSNQCPWVARSITELSGIAKENGIDVKISEIKTAEESQNAPTIYSVFNLIYNGKILSDHYISGTRFKNILKKEFNV